MEHPCELPENWGWANLGNLGTWSGGGTPSKANKAFWTNGTIPWVSPKDMKFGRIRAAEDSITEEAVSQSSAKFIPANSILMVTRSGILAHTFPVAVNECKVTVNQDLKTLTPFDCADPDFLTWYLRAQNFRLLKDCAKHGTTVASIDTDRLKKFSVPVAPVNEQRRIVEKIETLFARLDKGEEALRDVQKLLARYRQSVLKAAVTGQLTADWRAENAHSLEHGADLLARILQTRRKTWEGRGKYKDPAAPDTSDLPDLPDGWVWASVDQLLRAGLSNGRSVPDATEGFPVLRLTALKDGSIDTSERKIGAWDAKSAASFLIERGDILVSRGNGSKQLVGRGGLVADDTDPIAYPDTMIRIPILLYYLSSSWFLQLWNSPFMRRQIENVAKTTAGIYKINQTDIRNFKVPLPPLAEQEEVAAKVDEAFQKIGVLQNWCETELTRSAALRQSVLKDAFAGRLVPQDPADEPAAALLARIKETRTAAPRKTVRKARA